MSSNQTPEELLGYPKAKADCPSAPCSPPDWDRVKWRQLKAGERVEKGDWVDMASDGWRDNPKWVPATKIGEAAPDPAYPAHRIFRRVLEANAAHHRPEGDA